MDSHRLKKLFDDLSPNYDKVNSLLSMGLDKYWRRKLNEFIPDRVTSVVDLATGSGEQIAALQNPKRDFIGIDISTKMLNIAKKKLSSMKNVSLIRGDILAIPLAAESTDCVTMSYGIRNLSNINLGIRESLRILKKGGIVLFLDLSIPKNRFFKFLYNTYMNIMIPLLGHLFDKKTSYNYLRSSIREFSHKDIVKQMEQEGFTKIKKIKLTFGISEIYYGEKPL